VLVSWLVPAFALTVGVTWYLFASTGSPLAEPLGSRAFERRRFLSFMGTEYLASVLSSAVTLIGGAYALTTLGADGAAPFVTAAALVIVVENALASFAQALAVEASGKDGAPDRRRNLLSLAAAMLGGISAAAVLSALVFGHSIMGLLGELYRGAGGTALAILMWCVPARAIGVVSNADNRLRGQGHRNLLQQVVACVVFFGLLLTGEIDTIASLCWAVVAMRVVPALLAVRHLQAGRLRTSVA
jgi:O-antigen/teichoic acid export membrane protein